MHTSYTYIISARNHLKVRLTISPHLHKSWDEMPFFDHQALVILVISAHIH